jgi:integrase
VKVLEVGDLKELLSAQEGSEFETRDRLAILAAALWGLTASELSLLQVGDVVHEHGPLRKVWTLPAKTAYNGYERKISTEHARLIEALEAYLEWRCAQGAKLSGHVEHSTRYRGLDPQSVLMLNDNGAPFAFSKRSKAQPGSVQPTGINALFKRLIGRSNLNGGVTYTDFRRSFICHLAREEEGNLSMRNIMAVTGMRDYSGVKRIVDADTKHLKDVVKGIYNRL